MIIERGKKKKRKRKENRIKKINGTVTNGVYVLTTGTTWLRQWIYKIIIYRGRLGVCVYMYLWLRVCVFFLLTKPKQKTITTTEDHRWIMGLYHQLYFYYLFIKCCYTKDWNRCFKDIGVFLWCECATAYIIKF